MMDESDTTFSAEETAALSPTAPEPTVAMADAPEQVVEATEDNPPAAGVDSSSAPAAPVAEKPDAMVPSSRLREEADRRREVEQRYARDMGKLEERLNALQRTIAPPEQQKAPDWDTNPLEAGKVLAGQVQDLQQQSIEQRRASLFKDACGAAASEFIAKQPDYGDAYQHFARAATAQITAAGWNNAAQQLATMEANIAAKAFQDGVNPAERIYAAAKALGYAPKSADAPAPTATQQVATLARGAAASQSMAGAGNAPASGLTLNKLLEMDDHDFANLSERDWRKAMGA
jgi:hypothetical protein